MAEGSTFTARIGYCAEDALTYNNSIEGDYLQVIDYRYNIRGWLKQINDPSAPLSDDLFNMELNYNTPTANGGEAQFNGNISESVWKSAGLDMQSYGYDYDPMNRIMKGSYYNLAKPMENGHYDEVMGDPADLTQFPAYDMNGNIQNLLRNGKTAVGTYGLMDRLHYDYGGPNQTSGNKLMFVSDAQATGPEEEGFKEIVEGMTDYAYDENGNLTKDENKGIMGDAGTGLAGIEYNHLNLPSRVSKNLTDYMVYTYDATGRKLSQQVFGAEAKTTEYVGDLVFEDNALQFILHPEGRVVADIEPGAPDPWEYQYFLKDHLGNTRVVFSEKKNTTEYTATLEDDTQTAESATFFHYPQGGSRSSLDLFDHTDAGSTYTRSQLLTGGNNSQVGLARSFEVNPGDVVDLEVYAKYEAPTSTSTNLNAVFSQLVSAFSLGTATSPLDGAAAYSAFENLFQGGGPWINSSMWEEAPPKAYLNYILFDENFVLVDFGFDQLSTACQQVGVTPVVPHDYLSLHVKVEQKGYLYVYLSNEQPVATNVYFDDMKIVHYSAVEQVSDYYPFGLTFNSYQRENSAEQRWKFQGQEHIDDLGLNWDSFKWRNYQPDIGRFFNVDPLAEKYVHNSTHAFAENKVITFRELEGLEGVHYMESKDHIIEKNVIVMLRPQKVIPKDADAKTVKKIERQNARIGRANAALLVSVSNELNTFFNGGDGSGTRNSKGENVVFRFNVTGATDSGKADKKMPLADRNAFYKALGVSNGLLGRSSFLPITTTQISPAAVLTTEGPTKGDFGDTNSGITIRMSSRSPAGGISHEVLHTLGLSDNGYNKGGLLNSPPESIISSEVDEALRLSYERQ